MAAVGNPDIPISYFQLKTLREALQREETPEGLALLANEICNVPEISRLDLKSRDISLCKQKLDGVIQAQMQQALSAQMRQESPENRKVVNLVVDEWAESAPPEEAENRGRAARAIKDFLSNPAHEGLNLSALQLSSLPPVFQYPCFTKNLITLVLSENRLTELPKDICHLTRLSHLYLQNNKLTELPEEIGNLRALRGLIIASNLLTHLPAGIGQLRELAVLFAPSNRLRALPSEIAGLVNLSTAELQDNNIKHLPKELFNLSKIQILDLSSNQLETLPSEIGNLNDSLAYLALNNNQISELPEEIGRLRALQTLQIADNWLRSLPREMGNLNSLKTLEVQSNALQSLPIEMDELRELTTINIAHNEIGGLSPRIRALDGLQGYDEQDALMVKSAASEALEVAAVG